MIKKITIYTLVSKVDDTKKSFTTKKLATEAQEVLLHFGIETELLTEKTEVTI